MKWRNPPKSTTGRGRAMAAVIDTDVAELRANPGQWGLVRENARSSAPARTYKDRGCVAMAHRVNTKPERFDIYAMWPEESDGVKGDDAFLDIANGKDCS